MTRYFQRLRLAAFCGALCASTALIGVIQPAVAVAASQRILVVVNDLPITNRDVEQRMKLTAALGNTAGTRKQRKQRTLKTLIDEVLTRSEAKKLGLKPEKKRIDATIVDMAKGSNTTLEGLTAKLKKKGISISTLRAQVEATMILRWVVGRRLKTKIEVNEAEVDKRYAKISSDPRLKPVTVYQIRELDLPVENTAGAMLQQLMMARAVEAQQIVSRYKGCGSLKQATKGVFNVKISRMVQAPADKLPKDMLKILKQAGTKRLIGPMRAKGGIRLIANCGRKTIRPPKPPRQAIKNMVLNEKYAKATDRVMRDIRRRASIEYKDKSAVLTQ